ncbi:histidine--tRNA ligase, chloroplastic/mitochondrial-like [Miscanthus floridulus]|uniref:histidine--tRNA ligase, chloroplastic/mitochondrial-like n=1 Tax=Miscanthus floridulus TaxID=154761 RepID=UPI0034576048
MAALSSSPSLRHLLLLRPRLLLSPTCLAGSFSRRHIHGRRRLFSASSSTLTHGDAASTHGDADAVVDVNPPRGSRDFPPGDMRLRTWLFDQFREVSRIMAFEEVDFPVLESEALFIRKAGEEITQQINPLSFLYNFEDKGGRRVVLRPEITPSLARLVIKQGKSVSLPLKWFTIGQCWRYERMTRGRRREHYQWNMDMFGVPKVRAEAELLHAIVLLFQRLGVTSSDVGIILQPVLQAVLNMYSIPEHLFTEVCVIVDKLGKMTREEIEKELISTGLSSEAVHGIIDVLSLESLSKLEEVLGFGVEVVADLKKLFSFCHVGTHVRETPSRA